MFYVKTQLNDDAMLEVDITEANARDALAVRGPGTLKGGTITTLTLSESIEGGVLSGAPVLDGVSASLVVVDFGRDENDPLDTAATANLLVAKYSDGNPPSIGKWRATGTGIPHAHATFSVSGGEVRLNVVSAPGTMVLVF